MAFAYANGHGVDQNLKLAAQWMHRAAEQDDLEAVSGMAFFCGGCMWLGGGSEGFTLCV